MGPVRWNAHAGVIETRGGQRIQRECGPEAHENCDEHRHLRAHRCERDQEQERVPEPDLGERVLERPVRLRMPHRAKKDAEQDQHQAAPDGVPQHLLKALAPAPAARDGEREGGSGQEREGRLNQVVQRTPLPRHVRGVERHPPPEAARGKCVVERPQLHRLGEHQEHDKPAEHVDGEDSRHGRSRSSGRMS